MYGFNTVPGIFNIHNMYKTRRKGILYIRLNEIRLLLGREILIWCFVFVETWEKAKKPKNI